MTEMDFIELMYYCFKLEISNGAELVDGKLKVALEDGDKIVICARELKGQTCENGEATTLGEADCDGNYLSKQKINNVVELEKYLNNTINCVFDAVYNDGIITFSGGKKFKILVN